GGVRRRSADRARAFLVAARQVVQRLVEELTDPGVELLQAVEVHRQDVVAVDARKRRIDQAVVADVLAQVLLDDDDSVDELAQRDSLIEPGAPPVGELFLPPPRALTPPAGDPFLHPPRARIADPVAQLIQDVKEPLLEILGTDAAEPPRPIV